MGRKVSREPAVDYAEIRAYRLAERWKDLDWTQLAEEIKGTGLRPVEALAALGISDEIIDYPTSPLGLYIYRKTGRPLTSGFVGEAASLLNISWERARALMEMNAKVLNSLLTGADDLDEALRRLGEEIGRLEAGQ